jgi:hypothetical protein
VEKIASDFLDDWKELEGAGMYDHNLTYAMVNIIMEGGGSNKEDFRSPLRELKEKLNSAILKIRHEDYAAQNNSMTSQELDVQSVLNLIKEKYNSCWTKNPLIVTNDQRNFCGILMSELRSIFLVQRNHNLRNCTETTFIALSRP